MNDKVHAVEDLVVNLRERAKELNCIYHIEELVQEKENNFAAIFTNSVNIISQAMQYPKLCQARIIFQGNEYTSIDFAPTEWNLSSRLFVQGFKEGVVEVSYTKEMPKEDIGPFLKEELKLLHTVTDRIGHHITYYKLKEMMGDSDTLDDEKEKRGQEWTVVRDLLLHTNQDLFIRVSHKLLNYLCKNGIREAEHILHQISSDKLIRDDKKTTGSNIPSKRKLRVNRIELLNQTFVVAAKHLDQSSLISLIQRWMQEDKASFFLRTLLNLHSTNGDICDDIRKFHQLMNQSDFELSESIWNSIKVQLIRRILSEQLRFLNVAKNYVRSEDFLDLVPRMIFPPASHGKLGGKGTGLFLAKAIIRNFDDLKDIKTPRTWYLTSDGLHYLLHYNDLEDLLTQKYKDIAQVRQEYPQIVEILKNAVFSPEIIQKLSIVLDDLGNVPIIVRSSSLLEDRFGSTFSGKYESFFVANQGTKEERLNDLIDAIAEVYASIFSPDAIEYRAERNLLDFHEQMGVLIQEVVGKRIGPYYFPAYAGVAFSNNEFRWSPRIKQEDGLIRLVMGLGTRAVDRLGDDYPILLAPGQPGLRVNVTPDEAIRYSPHYMDVINLEENNFETVEIKEFVNKYGDEYPLLSQMISVDDNGFVKPTSAFSTDFSTIEPVVTFDGLINQTNFVAKMQNMLVQLQKAMKTPVDIEFASDGIDFYLLQCRAQGYGEASNPVPIPQDIPTESILFNALKYVSNGYVKNITHVVYVDPLEYSRIEDLDKLIQVGRIIGRLNNYLPKKQFILMGPGRWGSRGDIKLGVRITYSDISHTAMLIEMAMKKGNYTPDLSFGTHFFQDLVETNIRYLPLYPDDPDVIFDHQVFTQSSNILADIFPEYAEFEKVVRVIDIAESCSGQHLEILMNADLEEAVAILTTDEFYQERTFTSAVAMDKAAFRSDTVDHWRWRMAMAKAIAQRVDTDVMGVKAMYVFGSTKNASAGPGSDIDLLFHVTGDEKQRGHLMKWLAGWSDCVDEINYLRTGYRSNGLLDVHLVTDDDIANKDSYAIRINAVTDAAKELSLNPDRKDSK